MNVCKKGNLQMIETNIERLRDPFLLVMEDAYYAYGTGIEDVESLDENWDGTEWACYKNTGGRLDTGWEKLEHPFCAVPEDAIKKRWAPEVHRYNGKFYMIATYYSAKSGHKGCAVFRADSPEGIFEEISDGHITPKDWNAIDGTLYVDSAGQPWLVFVREWGRSGSTDDGVGRMVAAKLSDDLSRLVSPPQELFRADDPSWAVEVITDGCFMYTAEDGTLSMIWSNFCKSGYCVGVATSSDGTLTGKWKQHENLLYSREMAGDYDGGHGMIFTDRDGSKYLVLHAPNCPIKERKEKPILIPIQEENGIPVCRF